MTGPTWRCAACDTYNGAVAAACDICGTARSESPAAPAPTAGSGSAATSRTGSTTGAGSKEGAGSKATPSKPGSKAAGAKPGSRTGPAAGKRAAPDRSGIESMPPDALSALSRILTTGYEEGVGGAERLRGLGWPPGLRATSDLVLLFPDLFHPDGTPRADTESGIPFAVPPPATSAPRGRAASVPRSGSPRSGSPRSGSARRRPPPSRTPRVGPDGKPVPKATVPQQIAGCGCLLVLVGGLVFGIVMLILHGDAIFDAAGPPGSRVAPVPAITAGVRSVPGRPGGYGDAYGDGGVPRATPYAATPAR
ncbi:hypothetical protein SAMN05216223_10471 [Actinacidiphila yanglinensis]|uniref:RanBP2-type domain-containing protein n=1 Tax=Actinacidiphila yanglinensis TaxID=310779 RepID=A0A1H5YPM3_9ACTN|nr:hypothetical protein [Actinacidiphila yanglinensis]SEG25632.1 hypothetical protein SAMN05216223_10471 [Actinacidiphila yanglinensis]